MYTDDNMQMAFSFLFISASVNKVKTEIHFGHNYSNVGIHEELRWFFSTDEIFGVYLRVAKVVSYLYVS